MKTNMNLWAKAKDANTKCYFMEMVLFQIFKNFVSIQIMQNGDEWNTQKKQNRLETLKDIYNANTTNELLGDGRWGVIQRRLKIQEFPTQPKYLSCTKQTDFPDS